MNEEYSRIQHQPIDANNFELKLTLISMVQQQEFGGSPYEEHGGWHVDIRVGMCIILFECVHNFILFTYFSSVVLLFQVPNCMHRRSNSELLSFDPEIERALFRLKKIKVDNTEMEDHNTEKFSEGQSNHNEMPRIREQTLGDC